MAVTIIGVNTFNNLIYTSLSGTMIWPIMSR